MQIREQGEKYLN